MNRTAPRTILLLSADHAFAERVMSALMPRLGVIRGVMGVDNLDVLMSASDPDLCLIDIDGPSWDQPVDLAAIEQVRAKNPNMPIVIATTDLSSTLLISAMRLGVSDVCEKDFAPDELNAQIDRYANRRSKPLGDHLASLVTFLGAREGIGTTTTALAFSEAIATRSGADSRALLLDFSHPPAEIPDLIGARANYFMTDAVHDLARLDITMIESAFTRARPRNLFVLPLASTERGISSLSVDDVGKLLALLRTYFHSVVVDINWCWRTQLAALLFRAATHPILCSSQSVTSIHAVTAFLAQLGEANGPTIDHRIAITRHDPALKPSAAEIQNALGSRTRPYLIAEDREYVEMARNAGEPLISWRPRSGFVKSVKYLVNDIDKPVEPDPGGKAEHLVTRLQKRVGHAIVGLAGNS